MEGCVFCGGIEKDRVLFETTQWIAMYDKYPVSKGHVLLIPKEHRETFFDLSDSLLESLKFRINDVKNILRVNSSKNIVL